MPVEVLQCDSATLPIVVYPNPHLATSIYINCMESICRQVSVYPVSLPDRINASVPFGQSVATGSLDYEVVTRRGVLQDDHSAFRKPVRNEYENESRCPNCTTEHAPFPNTLGHIKGQRCRVAIGRSNLHPRTGPRPFARHGRIPSAHFAVPLGCASLLAAIGPPFVPFDARTITSARRSAILRLRSSVRAFRYHGRGTGADAISSSVSASTRLTKAAISDFLPAA